MQGLTEVDALFARLPQDVRNRAAWLLAELATEISAAQKAAVPKATGHLAGGLGVEELLDKLRARVGLLNTRKGRNSYYYGRFVEFGRRSQTVRVIRGTSASSRSSTSRRRRAAGQTLRKPYTLHVRAMPPREFIYLPDVEARAARRLSEFWSGVLPA
jgi:hypothetical protein